MGTEILKVYKFQGTKMARFQNNGRRIALPKRLRPASHAKTPTVTCLQPGKIIFRPRRRKIVTTTPTEGEKWRRHDRTDRVQPRVIRPRATIPISVKSRTRMVTTCFKRLSEDTGGHARSLRGSFASSSEGKPTPPKAAMPAIAKNANARQPITSRGLH